MTGLAAFRRQLAWRGADLARWPAGERARALRTLRRSAAARTLYLAAQAGDPGLAERAASFDPVRAARLAGAVWRRIAPPPPSSRPAGPLTLRWAAVAACAVLGVWIGWAAAPPAPPPPAVFAALQLTPLAGDVPGDVPGGGLGGVR